MKQHAQRQDSLDDQLRDVRVMAERMGCYDAADWIRARTLYEEKPALAPVIVEDLDAFADGEKEHP